MNGPTPQPPSTFVEAIVISAQSVADRLTAQDRMAFWHALAEQVLDRAETCIANHLEQEGQQA